MLAEVVVLRITSLPKLYTHEYEITPGMFDTFNDNIGRFYNELETIKFTLKQNTNTQPHLRGFN